jgi:RNA polymerase sigma-70 factor, ECF subfamily
VTVFADPASDHRFEQEAIPYMRQMYPAAVRLTGNRCDAEDLIQETFARAYQKFHLYKPGTNLRAWLYCIMSRTFYSSCRARSRRPAETLAFDLQATDGSHDGLVPAARSAEAEALDQLADSEITRALAELPLPFKTAVYLADVQGYRYSDIAEIMQTPVGTVMSRLHRARAMLRARLRPPAQASEAPACPPVAASWPAPGQDQAARLALTPAVPEGVPAAA